jgi:hypothetical protein
MDKLPIYFILAVNAALVCLTAVTCRAELLHQHSLVEKSVKQYLLRESSSIDVVYSDGIFSHIEYKKNSEISTRSESSIPPQFIEKPQASLFGSCRVLNGTIKRTGTESCGLVLRLSVVTPLNLAAVDSVEIAGSFSGRWRLAIADLPGYLRGDNQSSGAIIGPKGASFDLAPLVKSVDLTRVMSLVFLLDSSEGSASLERISFSHFSLPTEIMPQGIWMWNNRLVPGHEEEIAGRLVSLGIGRVYLQIDDNPGRFLPFVKAARKKGINVFALDGDPGYVTNPEPLLQRISKVAALAHTSSGVTFAGFQVDVEPYLNKDFALRKEYYVSAYLKLLSRLKEHGGIPLSVVVPFWFDSIQVRGTTLLQKVIEVADELVVMSYRTNNAELLAVSMTELGLGEKLGKPVYLGIELGRIPDERHVELETVSGAGDIQLAGMWWKKKGEYTVSGDRISFKNRRNELPEYMAAPIPFRSFGGWVLHSYEELGPNTK